MVNCGDVDLDIGKTESAKCGLRKSQDNEDVVMLADELSKLLENSLLKMLQISVGLLVAPEAEHREITLSCGRNRRAAWAKKTCVSL